MSEPTKVLIVDDSALMRVMIRDMLSLEPTVKIDKAKDGEEALKKVKQGKPHIVLLD